VFIELVVCVSIRQRALHLAHISSVTPEIPHILQQLEVHCSVHSLKPLSWARSIQCILSHQVSL